ncbi:MAG: hypothetical protein NTY07_12395 [Bacteroidia bacterium]|nr:hypothetical protein [Bacteroidia bacterium]
MQNFKLHLRNIPGWTTKQKIIVLESDDWGSVRMASKEAYNAFLMAGVNVNNSHFIANDALESNLDLELLFDVITKYKDSNGKNPVFTAVCVVANPDFEKIKANGFSKYEYEPFTETCKHYPIHDRVAELWKEGIQKRLFVPVFHGREHLNVQRWMRALQTGNKSLHFAFDHGVIGLSNGFNCEKVPDHLAAFDIEFPSDTNYLKDVIYTGTKLFEEICGYRARYFVPPNSPGNHEIETILKDCGIEFVNSGRVYHEPVGNGKYVKKISWLGKRNRIGQIYLTRNCFFEPVSNEWVGKDWVNDCLHEIDIAFRWHKPAIVSTHRVNYIGYIHPENRSKGLKALGELLRNIILRWPDAEFLTSVELGDLIKGNKG